MFSSKFKSSDGRKNTIIAVLAVIVVILAAILLFSWMSGQQLAAYKVGYQQGAADAVLQIMQQGNNCQKVQLYAGNVTMTFIQSNCLPSLG
jgi:flagellar biosynthesis/type III secretory pathway M-ring protein FliF/YscJ